MRRAVVFLTLLALPAVAPAQTVTITATDCRMLIRHEPAPDVAYRPGVDARGRPVAPADLNDAPQIKVPDPITLDVAVDLRRFGVPPGSPLFDPNVKVGVLRVERDGRVKFDGQPLGNPEIAALEAFCREHLAKRR